MKINPKHFQFRFRFESFQLTRNNIFLSLFASNYLHDVDSIFWIFWFFENNIWRSSNNKLTNWDNGNLEAEVTDFDIFYLFGFWLDFPQWDSMFRWSISKIQTFCQLRRMPKNIQRMYLTSSNISHVPSNSIILFSFDCHHIHCMKWEIRREFSSSSAQLSTYIYFFYFSRV